MSFFSRFKTLKTASAEIVQAEEQAQTITNAPPESCDSDKKEPLYSEHRILSELHKTEAAYPGVIQEAENHLTKIQIIMKNHLDYIDAYYEWEAETLSKEREEAEESSKDPAQEEAQEEAPLTPILPADASVEIFTSKDNMLGFLYCLPPIGNGKDVDEASLINAIENCGIQYGIMKETLRRIAAEKNYFCIYLIALGTAPIKGEDGKVTDHFLRTQEIRLEEDEKGVIDYKNLNLFKDIEKGDIICDVVPPKKGQDGHDIMGKTLPHAPGTMPPVPKGKNTLISDDKTALIAGVNGVISFQGNVFRIESQLTIPGNVGTTTGNIDFNGDVLVNGDVLRGFKIKANGNIIVLGMAEGATLISGEDIDIRKGINGSGIGILDAKGDIHSHFLEQTQVTAGGNVVAETIINCRITSGGSIFATAGKGIIIGGKLSVHDSVEAKRIGGTSDTKTIIKLGKFMEEEENIEYLNTELKRTKETLQKLKLNVTYLESLPSLSPEKNALYNTLAEQKQLYENMSNDLMRKIDEANNKTLDFKNCHVHGGIVYPITEITLNYSKICIQETTSKCNVYYGSDGLVSGNF